MELTNPKLSDFVIAEITKSIHNIGSQKLLEFLKSLLPGTEPVQDYDETQIYAICVKIASDCDEGEILQKIKSYRLKELLKSVPIDTISEIIENEFLVTKKFIFNPCAINRSLSPYVKGVFALVLKDLYEIKNEELSEIMKCSIPTTYRCINMVNMLSDKIPHEKEIKEKYIKIKTEIVQLKNQ